jgi:hypothetical protein
MEASEALGAGVLPPGETVVRYVDVETDLAVHVTLSKPDCPEQFCKACMWSILDDMRDVIGPDSHDNPHPTTDED